MARHDLYRCFAADGTLLYVGASVAFMTRLQQHRGSAPWFEEVARVDIEHQPSRRALLAAEKEAIRSELPRFNVAHHPAPLPPMQRGPCLAGWRIEQSSGGTVVRAPDGRRLTVATVATDRRAARNVQSCLWRMGAPEAVWTSLSNSGFGQIAQSVPASA